MTEPYPQPPPVVPDPGYPFRILRAFFSKVCIERPGQLPSEISTEQLAEVKFATRPEERQYQLHLRLSTPDPAKSPVQIEIESIGVFEYQGEGTPDKATLARFINNRLLFALTTTTAQILAATTALMAMPPIQLPIPLAFGITEDLIQLPSQESGDLTSPSAS